MAFYASIEAEGMNINMKNNKKPKRSYLLVICISIIYFTLIACIINDCRQITQDYVAKYKLHIEKISNLEDDPLALAEEFMQSEYDKHWDSLKNCWGKENLVGGYELHSYIISGRYATSFFWEGKNNYDKGNQDLKTTDMEILCNAHADNETDQDKSIIIAFTYGNSIQNMAVYIDYHGENPAESVHFNISLIENEYVADRINAEELTGLTIEEMVETAELNRKGFENLMYAMKEHELEESKNEFNSGLKRLYTIAALLIAALLTLWITVLAAMIKSKSGNKKQVLFHSKPGKGTKHENKSKNRKTHLLTIFVSLIYIILIAGIIIKYCLEDKNYIIAILLIVILLSIWIPLLIGILKSEADKKAQVLFCSKHDIDREIKSKNMRAYLLAMLISIIHITLIAGIIGLCRLTAENHVNEYNLHIEEVKNLEDDPLVLAEEFMRTAYDKHWNSLKGCHGSHDEYETENDYELSTHILLGSPPTVFTRYNRLGSNDSIWNTVPADKDFLIKCEAYADNTTEYDKNITIAFDYSENITYLTVCVEYYGNNQADPEYFIISLTQNGADAGTVNVEELTGLTIEEIVETAELNRKGFEDLMYAMKEHELEESKNELNSVLRRSYIITALHVVMFIGIWIYVLAAILKSIPSNKNRRTF